MPRRKRSMGGSAFQQVQRQARALLVTLRGEIRTKEAELKQLKLEEGTLSRLGGGAKMAAHRMGMGARSVASPAVSVPARRGRRVNWSAVLQQVPKQFKAADIRGISLVKGKRPSELFAAITRWIEAGLVKRKTRGVYERI